MALTVGEAMALTADREPGTGGWGRKASKGECLIAGVHQIPRKQGEELAEETSSPEHRAGQYFLPPVQSTLYHQDLSNTSDTDPPPRVPGETRMPHQRQ